MDELYLVYLMKGTRLEDGRMLYLVFPMKGLDRKMDELVCFVYLNEKD
jgi:hypothetical protein